MTDREPLRILHVMPIPLVPFISGCYRPLRQSRAVMGEGMEAVIACLKIGDESDRARLKEPFFGGIDIRPVLPNLPQGIRRELGILLLSWRGLGKCLDAVKPHIVHVHNPPDTMAFVTSLLCSRRKIPLVYDIHDSSKEVISATDFPPLLKKLYVRVALFFERAVIKRSKGIVTVSESLRDLMLRTRTVFRDFNPPFVVMRNVDEQTSLLSAEEMGESNEPSIFYSGFLYAPFIGLEFLMESIGPLLRSGSVRLLIAGDGPYRGVLERYIGEKGLSRAVTLLGHMKKHENIGMIRNAMLTVIPYERNSLTEIALPNKVFEYMALGKPVVYPDFPGFREVLGEDNEGKYIPGDRKDLSRVIERFLRDRELRKRTGLRNRELSKGVTFGKEFSGLLEMYRLIAQDARPAGGGG